MSFNKHWMLSMCKEGTILWTSLMCERLKGMPAFMISPTSDGDVESGTDNSGMGRGSGAEPYLKLRTKWLLFVCAKDSMQKKGNELVYEKNWSGSSVGRWYWKHMHQLGTVSVLRAVNQTPKCHQCSRFLLSFSLMIHSVKLSWEVKASWAWTSLSHAPMWAHTHTFSILVTWDPIHPNYKYRNHLFSPSSPL